MFSAEELPVNRSLSPDYEKDWTTRVVTSCSPFSHLLSENSPDGSFGRMSPVSCRVTEDGILVPSSEGWQNSGMGGPTESLTLSITEWPSDADVCLLSDVLETQEVPLRYYLSATACRGILRRAAKRGKKLPELLAIALETVAKQAL